MNRNPKTGCLCVAVSFIVILMMICFCEYYFYAKVLL